MIQMELLDLPFQEVLGILGVAVGLTLVLIAVAVGICALLGTLPEDFNHDA